MWWQGQQPFHNQNFPSPRTDLANPEAHGHSPRHQQDSKENAGSKLEAITNPSYMPHGLVAHPTCRAFGTFAESPFWFPHASAIQDPFTSTTSPTGVFNTVATRTGKRPRDDSVTGQSRTASSTLDLSMPDYSRPLSPASSSRRSYPMTDYFHPPTQAGSRHASGFGTSTINEHGLSRLESMLQSHQENEPESQFSDMMASFSPRNNSNQSGISAPSNTRVNSAANTPPLQPSIPSTTAQDPASLFLGHPRSVAVTARDPPPRTFQTSHNGSKFSSDFDTANITGSKEGTEDMKLQSETIIKRAPIGKPKGRKEGRTNEIQGSDFPTNKTQRRATTGVSIGQGKENNATNDEKVSDGKRKRASNTAGLKIALEDRLANHDHASPTRKASKIGREEASPPKQLVDMDDLTEEGVIARAPLGELENRM